MHAHIQYEYPCMNVYNRMYSTPAPLDSTRAYARQYIIRNPHMNIHIWIRIYTINLRVNMHTWIFKSWISINMYTVNSSHEYLHMNMYNHVRIYMRWISTHTNSSHECAYIHMYIFTWICIIWTLHMNIHIWCTCIHEYV